MMIDKSHFKKLTNNLWEVPKSARKDMLVPARIYASEKMLDQIFKEKAVEQLINMTTLPGIEKYALAMPDVHQGYGFPIGGVAAFRADDGIISPGGVGYDINCGVRLLASKMSFNDVKNKLPDLITQIQREVPSGVGRGGNLVLNHKNFEEVLNQGIKWAIKNGYASENDALVIEEGGSYKFANAKFVSSKAKERGADQLGTLGAGNHFLEIQRVIEIYDTKIAEIFGLFEDQITIMIHTGSRGLGHQVCTDYVNTFLHNINKFNIHLADRELACAPFKSAEGQEYLQAMAAACNFAWVNRQVITHSIKTAWAHVLKTNENALQIVYDVAHNIAKLENHFGKELVVHRKGATRAFAPHHPDLPDKYKTTGQPVIIPGSMGTFSYVLAGTNEAMQNTFGSACHGAGRRMSRMKSKKTVDYQHLLKYMENYGVTIRAGSVSGLIEEAPEAYKDIDEVVNVISAENIGKKVAKLRPVAIVKG
jgi:tRNA-splicing ligase RtcB